MLLSFIRTILPVVNTRRFSGIYVRLILIDLKGISKLFFHIRPTSARSRVANDLLNYIMLVIFYYIKCELRSKKLKTT